jgi:anti-sigma regulatory factor (Ser/Thr protein kinase)
VEVTLPSSPTSARAARRFVVDALTRLELETLADVAELLVSELVTNALLHAGSEVRVRVLPNGERLRVEVLDTSDTPVIPRDFGPDATTGRGLGLVEHLAARWGCRPTSSGKAVWFELDEAVRW